MSDIENKVTEIINDLKNKIDELSLLGEGADADKLAKIKDVKQKAINVLTQVSNKISDTANSAVDTEELQNAIDVVKIRSRQLYDNAVSKINELMCAEEVEEIKEEVKEVANDVKNDIDEFFKKEEIKNAINNVEDATVEITDKAINCLKEWLRPEEK